MNSTSLQELFSLEGRVVLFTGASGDLGRAMARGLALAGASLALNGRSETRLAAVQDEICNLGASAEIFPADISYRDALPVLVEGVIKKFGHIDILVNCAGINQRQPIQEVSREIYDRIMGTNLRAAYFLSQAVVPHMVAQGSGKILHIGSITAAIGLEHVSVYGMAKAGLSQLTKTMAVEYAEHNIQVNCICPGFFSTDLTVSLWDNDRRRHWMLDRIPTKRGGKPDELMGTTILLTSSASSYITGQTIYIDGGFLAGSQW
jgi:2-deoxy-D-gluconate 3-dehydrogenase